MKRKCLLIGVNAKYIHTNLAIRYLRAYSIKQKRDVEYMEFSINDNFDKILRKIYNYSTDIYAFSCYIWNIDIILKLCSSLKKLKPESVIILGGPEVSFDTEELMLEHHYIDYIVRGEGEESFSELIGLLETQDQSPASIFGLTYKDKETVITNPDRPLIHDLNIIPYPYEDFEELDNKIIYYETSRGCPFSCQYCLSSTFAGVRYFPMDRIKQELKSFIEKGVKQIKFVDRTFNCNKRHSLEIIEYIMQLKGDTNFHFEIGADLLDEEIISTLAQAPKDMFQFEIGVQSTNQTALNEVSRNMNLNRLKQNIIALQTAKNSHMHLDLIAGLPYEDFNSFANSFDEVHKLLPDMLQLGFLKLLKGSGIRKKAREYQIEYNSFNPYEVLKTKWISYDELSTLKEIEHLLELYYNSGRFINSLNYIFNNHYASYFQFYQDFSKYWSQNSLFDASQSTKELYNILHGFAVSSNLNSKVMNELIKLDWLLYFNNGNMPVSLIRYDHSNIKSTIQEYIKTNDTVRENLSIDVGIERKNLLKYITYEVFSIDVLHDISIEDEHIIFFAKGTDGNTKAFSKKLSDII